MAAPRTRLVLVGCGHAHLFVLEALARGRLGDVEATLVSPADEYFYSGMIPGVVGGFYTPEEARFAPARLAGAGGARWIRAAASRIDTDARTVVLDDGERIPWDLLSLDIGSAVAGDATPGVAEHAVPVKPMREALRLLDGVNGAGRTPADPARVTVVGGGAAGVEMAICLHARHPQRARITLLEGADRILAEYPARFRRVAGRLLRDRGIEVRTGSPVASVTDGAVHTRAGDTVPHERLLWATGPRARPLAADSGLPVDRHGFVRVGPHLQVAGHPRIFAAGDCVALDHAPWVPKAGVYAVREGPVLAENLRRAVAGKPPREYQPQRHWLSLMNTGDGRALMHYRGVVHHGRAPMWIKDRIDRRFMRRFQRLER